MKTRAAVLRDMGKDWEIIDLNLPPPKDGEVLIRFVAAGLCHSDDHLRTGDIPVRYPIVGGHEGAGIVEEVGPGVNRLKPGDHVVCSFLPTCGHCRFCASGMTSLCDLGALFIDNCLPDGTFRFHSGGEDFGQMCLLGTFSQRSVVSEHSCIKIDDDLPLETVAGSVWTGDPERGMRIARRARVGTFGVNLYVPDIGAPWGGRKASGMGRIYGPEGLDSYLATKCVFLPN